MPMPLPRSLLAFALLSLVTVVVGLGLLSWWRLGTGPRVARLVSEAGLLEQDSSRPSHVTPATPGSFAQALMPLQARLSRTYSEADSPDSEEGDSCTGSEALVAGGPLPAECEHRLEPWRGLLREVLEATHARRGGLPGHFRKPGGGYFFFATVLMPLASTVDVPPELPHVAGLAVLELRRLQAQGQTARAVDTCLDVLALGRDMALGSGVRGRRHSASVQERAFRPCAEALAAAPLERQRRAAEQLALLSQGWPTLVDTIRTESVATQLITFGSLLTPRELSRLPPAAGALASGSGFRWDGDPPSQLMARELWRKTADWFSAMQQAAALPPALLPEAFAKVDARFQQGAVPHTHFSRDYVLLAQEAERQATQLRELRAQVQAAAERATQGR